MNPILSFPRVCRIAVTAAALLGVAAVQAESAASARKIDEKNALPYRITRTDRLAVAVFDEPGLTSGGHKVDQRGMISLQLIGEIRVVGMTVPEAQTAIENAYRDQRFLRNPQVNITIEEYAWRGVNISGKVNQQGRKELPPDHPMTIKELILAAGGFQDTARGTDVRVTRTMPDGSLQTFHLDVQSALLGKDKASAADANFVLEPDDTIFVPEKII
jgi:polysaccharide export outer membrane protein